MSNLLAIDPGPVRSAFVLLNAAGKPIDWDWRDNDYILHYIRTADTYGQLVIEDVSHMGMAVGREVFETVRWSGRFDPDCRAAYVDRKRIKLHLCGNPQAKDGNIRQALIDRFGGESVAIGGVKCRTCHGKGWRGRGRPVCGECGGSGWEHAPGVLHGVASHCWSALAVALTFRDRMGK